MQLLAALHEVKKDSHFKVKSELSCPLLPPPASLQIVLIITLTLVAGYGMDGGDMG